MHPKAKATATASGVGRVQVRRGAGTPGTAMVTTRSGSSAARALWGAPTWSDRWRRLISVR